MTPAKVNVSEEDGSAAIVQPTSGAVERIEEAFGQLWVKQNEEASAGMDEVLARILGAATVEELLGSTHVAGADDYLNVPLLITGFRVVPSSIKTGEFFAVLDAALSDGTRIDPPIACGSKPLKAQLLWLHLRNEFPVAAMIVRNETRDKFRVYRLQAIDDAPAS